MSHDPVVPRVVRRHLGEPTEAEAAVEDAADRHVELLGVLLAAARELDHLQWEACEALNTQPEDPENVLHRIGARRRALLAVESDAGVRLRDVANQARALLNQIHRENTIDWRDVVRALEGIVEAAGVVE